MTNDSIPYRPRRFAWVADCMRQQPPGVGFAAFVAKRVQQQPLSAIEAVAEWQRRANGIERVHYSGFAAVFHATMTRMECEPQPQTPAQAAALAKFATPAEMTAEEWAAFDSIPFQL